MIQFNLRGCFRKALSTIFFLCFFFSLLTGQENIGINQDNYAPVNSRFLNPSSIVDAGTWLDINIIGFSLYTRSNFVFLPNTYIPQPSTYGELTLMEPNQSLYGYSANMVLGPSLSLVIHKNSFAFHSAARSYLFVKNLPEQTIGFIEDSTSLVVADGIYKENRLRLKELTWEEYGFTYGRILKRKNKNMFNAALTVNRLYGLSSGGLYMKSAELEVDNQNGTFVNIEKGQYWYNEPARLSGKGWSGSLGFTFKKMRKDISNYVPHSVFGSCKLPKYKYKLGISLLDVGAIKFNQNALYKNFDEDTPIDSIKNWTDITDQALSEADGTSYLAWLPAALSLQYDHNFKNHIYGHLSIINRVTLPGWKGVERANLLTASVRYERKKFSAAIPFTLHEYQYPQLGLSLRLWFVTIGTNQLIPLIQRKDVYSADVYLYFKIPIFISPECRFKSKKDKKGKGNYKKILCPTW